MRYGLPDGLGVGVKGDVREESLKMQKALRRQYFVSWRCGRRSGYFQDLFFYSHSQLWYDNPYLLHGLERTCMLKQHHK